MREDAALVVALVNFARKCGSKPLHVPIELTPPLGIPNINPISRPIARARKVPGIGKGFEEHGAEVVIGLPVPDKLLGRGARQPQRRPPGPAVVACGISRSQDAHGI